MSGLPSEKIIIPLQLKEMRIFKRELDRYKVEFLYFFVHNKNLN